jgi:hypothetical protein
MRPEADADPHWVSALAGCSLTAGVRGLEEARAERRLFSHLARAHGREGRASYIEIDAPLELYALVRELRPAHVVEVGVSSGVSTAYLLEALRRNRRGVLHSVDRPTFATSAHRPRASWSLPPGREPGWAIPSGLREGWDLRVGDKAELLPQLAAELPQIDLLLYDVPHDDAGTFGEFLSLDPRLRRGGVAIADHGPGGSLCGALARWARRTGSTPVGRTGLGLYGFAKHRAPSQATRRPHRGAPGSRSSSREVRRP